ncbi:Copper radical oxidase [Mycena venus]|uniref:Copper radical oxidase n=1 Tax=Mycena venus TaxID=2733690 RepID=A0A8H6XUZ8_9AGAR|nr:Copper radical oxidase [Mycena venus]
MGLVTWIHATRLRSPSLLRKPPHRPFPAALPNVVPPVSNLLGCHGGNECFCGNDLGGTAASNVPGSGLALPQTECNIPCTGDASSICGGGFRLSVYTVPASTIKKRTARSNLRHSLERRSCPGAPAPCYVDSCDNPALPFLSSKSPLQTVSRCIAECAAANYKLAGLSWADECYCGNELGGTAAMSTPGSGLALPQTECNMPCAGRRFVAFFSFSLLILRLVEIGNRRDNMWWRLQALALLGSGSREEKLSPEFPP